MISQYILTFSANLFIVNAFCFPRASLSEIPSLKLQGKVCLVTGAARGIGRGIAIGLGSQGATVYVTGRTEKDVKATASEVTERGGRGIPVVVDHSKVDEIKALFEKIRTEQPALDVLVNNCYSAAGKIFETNQLKFYEKDLGWWDEVNNVGLKAHFVASQLAVPLMLNATEGAPRRLIAHVSSAGGLRYIFDVAYGVGKAGVDRLAQDMAVELRGSNLAVVALWPGAVATELVQERVAASVKGSPMRAVFDRPETPEFQGRVVAALAADPDGQARLSGKVLLTSDLGHRYKLTDLDGRPTEGLLSLSRLLRPSFPFLASLLPPRLRVPNWLLNQVASKF